jgi:hypothetical protein
MMLEELQRRNFSQASQSVASSRKRLNVTIRLATNGSGQVG